MHLRYIATDKRWDIDLKLEGLSEEQESYWALVLQRELALLCMLYPELSNVGFQEEREG